MNRLKSWGITLMFIGAAGFLLPLIGMQFRLLSLLGDGPAGRLVVAGIGLVLFLIGSAKGQGSSKAQPVKTQPVKTQAQANSGAGGGTAAARTCPNPQCRRPLAANKKFCTACGTKVA